MLRARLSARKRSRRYRSLPGGDCGLSDLLIDVLGGAARTQYSFDDAIPHERQATEAREGAPAVNIRERAEEWADPLSCLLTRAERVGFEPTMACAILAFQASALGQTMRPLQYPSLAARIIARRAMPVNCYPTTVCHNAPQLDHLIELRMCTEGDSQIYACWLSGDRCIVPIWQCCTVNL